MYAIIQTGGKQYKVQPGDMLNVELLKAEPGATVELTNVLMVAGDDGVKMGEALQGAVVRATVVAQTKGPKLTIFKYKPKIRFRRKTGHRQPLTRLKIGEIVLQ